MLLAEGQDYKGFAILGAETAALPAREHLSLLLQGAEIMGPARDDELARTACGLSRRGSAFRQEGGGESMKQLADKTIRLRRRHVDDPFVEAIEDQHGTELLDRIEDDGRRLFGAFRRGFVQDAAENFFQGSVGWGALGTVAEVEVDWHRHLRVVLADLFQVQGETLQAGGLANAVFPKDGQIMRGAWVHGPLGKQFHRVAVGSVLDRALGGCSCPHRQLRGRVWNDAVVVEDRSFLRPGT